MTTLRTLFIVGGTLLTLTPNAPAQHADLILHNGKIVTVDGDFSIAEAMAVSGDRLLQVGNEDEVMATRGDATRVIDLGGKTVLPGLIDSHTHPTGASMIEFDHPIPDLQTIADVLEYIRDRAEAAGEGNWVVVRQVFITRLQEQRYPTRQELDEVCAEESRPVRDRAGCLAELDGAQAQRNRQGFSARRSRQGRT